MRGAKNVGAGEDYKGIVIILLIVLCLAICSIVALINTVPQPLTPRDGEINIGIPNPSAVYCQALGYQYKIVETENGGQVGICVFPDKNECRAWDFFAGKCGEKYTYCARIGGKIVATGSCPYARECAICLLPNGTRIPEIELMGLDKIISDMEKKVIVPENSETKTSKDEQVSLPSAFDWRNKDSADWTTPVKDQGYCGSCWAFSAVGVTEAQYDIASGNPDLDFDLSEENLVSNCSDAGTCCGGWHEEALKFIKNRGITDEECFPYVDEDCYCGICAVEAVLYESGANNSGEILSTLRDFRDNALKDEYVRLYYEYSPEIKEILTSDVRLLAEAAELVQKYAPALAFIVGKGGYDFQVKQEDINRISTFIERIEERINGEKEKIGENKCSEMISLLQELREQLEKFKGENFSDAFRNSIYYKNVGESNKNECYRCGVGQYACYCTYSTDNACSNAKCDDRCVEWKKRLWKISEMGKVTNNQADIKKKLIEVGPLSVAMGIGDEVGGYWDGEIYRCKDDSQINHAVVIVGYNDTKGYWIVRNSWGEDWNGDGHFFVGYGECSIENYVYYAKVSAVPSVSVSTDKQIYTANETMEVNITLANPTDAHKDAYFTLSLDIPAYNWSKDVINRSFTMPTGSKIGILTWKLPDINASFEAYWIASLYDATLKLLSKNVTAWQYVPAPPTPAPTPTLTPAPI